MKKTKIVMVASVCLLLTSCASSYKKIKPKSLSYSSQNSSNNVTLEYKYDLLNKKYKKKESKNNVKLIAIKITNNSDVDYTFGNNLNLSYENGNGVLVLDNEQIFQYIRQKPATYLWYLLLAPVQLYSGSSTNSYGQSAPTNSFPIGLIAGPGLAGGNMIGAAEANRNLKKDLAEYGIIGKIIKKGETVYGLVGIKSEGYESLKLNLN